MNLLKSKFVLSILALFAGSNASALQQTNSVTAEYKVSGNCGMCEKTIEKAAKLKGVSKADWNTATKVLVVTYNVKKTSSDAILKKVAYAGYDNEKYLAPDASYSKLHGCCKYERAEKIQAGTKTENPGKPATENQSASKQQKNELEKVYDLYFEVKEALIKDDSKLANSISKTLFNALGAVKMESLSSEGHLVFMKNFAELKNRSTRISESKDIEQQRQDFTTLSEKMFELMKVAKPSYSVYLDHCPMYNDGKGADWISKETAIKNPYYGSKMLTCGKIKETIK